MVRPSGESREAERRRELSSEYDRYRAAYASRAEREEAPDLTRREERGASQPGTPGCRKSFRPERCPPQSAQPVRQAAAPRRSGRSIAPPSAGVLPPRIAAAVGNRSCGCAPADSRPGRSSAACSGRQHLRHRPSDQPGRCGYRPRFLLNGRRGQHQHCRWRHRCTGYHHFGHRQGAVRHPSGDGGGPAPGCQCGQCCHRSR